MFSRVRRHINATTVVAVVALVFAMTGGAFAASKFLITSTKQIKPSVLASLKGKAGAKGAAGPAGAQGAAGAQGPAGTAGPAGKDGAAGANGTNGASVTSKQLSTNEAACAKEGGTELTAAEGKKTTVCNGKTGFTSTLPSGKTETGVWSIGPITVTQAAEIPGRYFTTSISFPIPLEASLDENHVKVIGEHEVGKLGEGCGGGSAEMPIAEPGYLCVYVHFNQGLETFFIGSVENGEPGAGKDGATLAPFTIKPKGQPQEVAVGTGVWAVTAP